MSNAPRIYVRGSYIDIHDNENVYLTVDKDGEVKTHIDERQMQQTHAAPPAALPAELCTDEARLLHERLVEAGMMDEDWQPVALSGSEKALLASELSRRLGITSTWQTFSRCWDIKPETLRASYNRALNQRKSMAFQDRLKEVLNAPDSSLRSE